MSTTTMDFLLRLEFVRDLDQEQNMIESLPVITLLVKIEDTLNCRNEARHSWGKCPYVLRLVF